jgi:hypothetical protein
MKFLSRVSANILLLAILLGLLRFIGHVRPVAPEIHAWRLDECAKPCWMDITPGQSTLRQAYLQVAELLLTFGYTLEPYRSGFPSFLRIKDGEGSVDQDAKIYVAGQTGVVSVIGIWRGRNDQMMPTFGDFVSLFGAPTCLASVQESNSM